MGTVCEWERMGIKKYFWPCQALSTHRRPVNHRGVYFSHRDQLSLAISAWIASRTAVGVGISLGIAWVGL